MIRTFRWHIKRSQEQLEVYNIFVKYISAWSWIWFLPVSYSALLAHDLKLAGEGWLWNPCEGFHSAHQLAFSHVPRDEFLNIPKTPLNKNDQLRPKNHLASVHTVTSLASCLKKGRSQHRSLLSHRTVRTTTKSNQFQTSAKTRHMQRDLSNRPGIFLGNDQYPLKYQNAPQSKYHR